MVASIARSRLAFTVSPASCPRRYRPLHALDRDVGHGVLIAQVIEQRPIKVIKKWRWEARWIDSHRPCHSLNPDPLKIKGAANVVEVGVIPMCL